MNTAALVLVLALAGAPGASQSSSYQGHGLDSVDAATLARFAPPPLPPETSREIQAMLDVRAPGAGTLSDDGQHLYFSWTITGTRQVWAVDKDRAFPRQVTGGEDPTVLHAVTPDGKWLVVSRDRRGEENPGIYLLPTAGGAPVVVQHTPKVQTTFQHLTPDGKTLYFRANDVKPDSYAIYRVDLATRTKVRVFADDGLWRLDDVAASGKLLLAREVGGNMTEYFELDEKTKTLAPLFGQGEREDYEAQYGAGDEVLVLTPKLSDFRRLYRFAGKDGLVPVSAERAADVMSFRVDDGKKRLLLVVNEGGRLSTQAFDAKSKKSVALPASLPSGDKVVPGDTTRDGRFTTFSVDPGDGPAKSYVVDWSRSKAEAWVTPSVPEIDASSFVRATLEYATARDGTKIPMWVARPSSCASTCAVIVDFHGGPEAQATAGFSPITQIYVRAGFVHVRPNVRGSDGYGKAWVHADDGPKRLDVITDIEDIAKHIRSTFGQGGVAPKIGITGGSYGGYSTLVGMTLFAGAYDAGAEVVGMSNLVTFLMNTAPYRRALRISEYGDPEKDRVALEKLSPIHFLDRVKGPLLLVQGANDPRVPVGEAMQIHDALLKRKLPVKLHVFADEGHGAQKRDNQVLIAGHTVRFFQETLR